MIREYIVKISDEIMEEEIADRPQELVRCKDCFYHDETDGKNFCDCGDRPDDWFCAGGIKKNK